MQALREPVTRDVCLGNLRLNIVLLCGSVRRCFISMPAWMNAPTVEWRMLAATRKMKRGALCF